MTRISPETTVAMNSGAHDVIINGSNASIEDFHHPPLFSNATHIAKDVLLRFLLPEMALLVIVISSNFVVLCVIHKSHMWARGQNCFIVHLVVIHLLRAAFFLSTDFYYLSIIFPSTSTCHILACITLFFASIDAHAVSLLFFDRLIFISAPATHRSRMTGSAASLLCIYNILQGTFIAVSPYIFRWADYDFLWYLGQCTTSNASHLAFLLILPIWSCGLPLVSASTFFVRIFFISRQRMSQVHVLAIPPRCRNSGSALEATLNATFRVLCIIYAIFLISWVPHVTLSVIYAFTGTYDDTSFFVCQTLSFAGGALNPWLYGMYNRRFRRTLKHLIICLSETSAHRISNQPQIAEETQTNRPQRDQPYATNGSSQPYTIQPPVRWPCARDRARSESLIGLYNYPMDFNPGRRFTRPKARSHPPSPAETAPHLGIHKPQRGNPPRGNLQRGNPQSGNPQRKRLLATSARQPNFNSLGPDMINLSISD